MSRITVSFYDPATGLLDGRSITVAEHRVAACTPAGMAAIEGRFDHLAQRVDLATGQVIDYQPPKPADTETHTHAWDAATKRWVAELTTEGRWAIVRAERDRRLAETDFIVLRAIESGGQATLAWRQYRQALRDITTQPDPTAITWPQKS